MICKEAQPAECRGRLRAIQDTMDILSGKWKMTIIACLGFQKKRFMDLQREVEGIGPKMLAKELQELEINGLVQRTVSCTKPLTVEYHITEYGQTLRPVIHEMAVWGKQHRHRIMHTTS
ncbi:transcriptional regulator, HxlR family [Filimonas lacunae]|uniref:Transcriptional regulator, HxlR family n=1 Tax=Filimonas lacunae TaxID=477680 RepID=A0A173MPM6_9BACT|nr:helix-turn-helix domain-containing protein [Filimonas lacunae]BAV09417.1 transcriptional regulator, HxlR family [Filimonas lacunae]SIS72762.1 transcriptional regulator, HxlR family [Filimonas lacunae]